ncbi:DNA topoisomerase 3 [Thermodesulfovibrio yellowstonii]|uniref:DNA topoisomerase 3 n=1 Tax=Thermodesulfovibrio yellowstonii TaxID=28262 RepID=UPI00041E51DD|nr:DNA topoisomerase 3 [Thermodesulfovibrio islandicus]
MPKTLLLCEKPSVAIDFARALGQFQKHDGYLENEHYIITWAYGHLCELKEPEEYAPELKKWSLDTLPIFPQRFEYRVIQSAKKQFEVIKKLLHRSDVSRVVNCGDPGREGELIQRLIFKLAGNTKPVCRFWTSEALTPEVIRKNMQNLKPQSEFDRLYYSALARQWADWLVGINCTRAVTCKNRELFSVGRVQTAVLALVVQREQEIRNFKPQTYYNVSAEFLRGTDAFRGIYFKKTEGDGNEEDVENENSENINSKYAIKEKAIADRIVADVKGQKGVVQKIITKISQDPPPLLFSLTTLQQEANRLFGFSAEQTLQIAQSLYEKHLLSYPRTESQHLDPGYAKECVKILEKIQSQIKFDLSLCSVNQNNKRVFDASKLTDHHALIPQGVPEGALAENERKIYELVCKRFVSAFYPDCKFKNTSVYVKVGSLDFVAKGKILLDPGWRAVYGGLKSEVILPELRQGEKLLVKDAQTQEKQTQPPPRYTDAGLLEVMANAHRVVKDERLRKILKENAGIGTPATRAAILKTLEDRKYLIKKGRNFIPTQKAEFLINLLKDEKVASPEYTAVWEQELDRIAKGELKDINSFLNDIKTYVKYFVEKVKNASAVFVPEKTEYTKKTTSKKAFKKTYSKSKVKAYSTKKGG